MNTAYDSDRELKVNATTTDREQVAEILRDQHRANRLAGDELEQRLQAAAQAQTVTGLIRLIEDLPGRTSADRQVPAARHAQALAAAARQAVARAAQMLPVWPLLFVLAAALAVAGHHAVLFAITVTVLAAHVVAPRPGRRPQSGRR